MLLRDIMKGGIYIDITAPDLQTIRDTSSENNGVISDSQWHINEDEDLLRFLKGGLAAK